MNFLLDTHSFLWFINSDAQLSRVAHATMTDAAHTLFLSAASLWEMAIKISLGKLTLTQPYDPFIPQQLTINRINVLDIQIAHTAMVAVLPFHHRDPFDRLIIAQSLVETMPIIGRDGVFDMYGVTRLW